jgi:hypothetical protein
MLTFKIDDSSYKLKTNFIEDKLYKKKIQKKVKKIAWKNEKKNQQPNIGIPLKLDIIFETRNL